MELFVNHFSGFRVQKGMHFRRKNFIKAMMISSFLGLVLLFAVQILYYNRLAMPQIKKRHQVIQWTGNSDQQLLGPNNRRIYFHETSGRSRLTMRQSCAVESAAKENPDRPIQLIMQTDILTINKRGTWLNDVLSNYPNVAVILINEMDYFRDTPLEDWYRKGEWRQSPHKVEHFSDYIRMLSSLKGGGLYMDLDFVTIKRLEISNFLAVEDEVAENLSNGIFHFDYGHRLIREIVQRLADHYQPEKWNAHGPALIFSIMSKVCGLKKGQPLSNECQDVALMPYNFVYPIQWPDWRVYFQKATRNVMQWINGSYAVHVWNKMSHSESLLIGSDQVYSILASRHCPFTVARAAEFRVATLMTQTLEKMESFYVMFHYVEKNRGERTQKMVVGYISYHAQRCSSKLLPPIRFPKKTLLATALLIFALSAVFLLFSYSNIESSHFFYGFNNETGAKGYIVPNIIHYIRFNMTEYSFVDYLCLQSAFLRQRPDYVYIHTDVPYPENGGFRGKYWDMITVDKKLMSSIRFLPIELASEIFGQPLSRDWRVYHGSDIARIRTMMKYGGIYLDNDVLVLQNLDKYRRFEISMNWDEGDSLGSQVIVAHKNARFLSRWLDSYHDYRADIWYYNAGDLPVKAILNVHPELLHRVKGEFGADSKKSLKHFTEEGYEGWRKNDAIHLLVNHLYSVKPEDFKPLVFDEKMIQTYKFPFGQMAREVLAAINETKTTV